MPAITRKTATIFASNAGVDQIAEFGSLAANTPTFTTDPAVIQSLSNYTTGWRGAVIGNNSPAIEDMNALCYVFSYQIAYLLQAGIAAWDSGTTYFAGNFVNDGNGNIYYSLTNSNLNNIVTNVANWKLYNSIIPGWSSTVSYSSGDFVSYSNSLYYSLINSNLNNTPSTSPSDWQLFVPSSFGNYVNILEPVEQKSENEHYGIFTDSLDNSIASGFYRQPSAYYNQGILLESTTGTSSAVVWSPVVLNQAAKDTTTTTNWAIVANAITLTTSATSQVGAASVSFTKDASGLASIKYDYGSVSFYIPNNTRLWFWINLANITSFQNVNVTVSTDATSYGTNYETYTTATNYAGSAITTGWNLCFINLGVAGTPSGTGWNSTQTARFFTIGINTTSATSTVVLVNGIYFSYTNPSQYTPAGDEMTVFDGTHTENFQIDTSNTQVDGPITLTNTLSNTYAGGFVGASVYRSTLTIGNNQALLGSTDPNGNSLTGAITTAQSLRLSKILRSALSNNTLSASATVNTTQVYSISSTTTNVIVVNDSVNQSANLLSGDTVHVFSSNYDGVNNYIYLGDFVLTSNSSGSGGLTTLTGAGGVPGGTAAGGYVVKKHATASYSAISEVGNETFNTLSPVESPNGVILMNAGLQYPYPQNVWAHYPLGFPYSLTNIYGGGPNLTQVGTLTYTNQFKNGMLAAAGWSSSNYLNDGLATSPIDGATNTKFTVSVWYYSSSNAASKVLIGKNNNSTTGWDIGVGTNVANTLTVSINGSVVFTSSPVLNLNSWNHIVLNSSAAATLGTTLWLNGVCVGNATETITASSTNMSIGVVNVSTSPLTATDLVADVIFWSGVNLNQNQILQIYNNGIAVPVGSSWLTKYRYQATGVNGQRLTYKVDLATDTTAVTPSLTDMQIIKTG